LAFEVYKPRRGGGGSRSLAAKAPQIRISKTSLVLNKWAREALDSSAIELAYDPEIDTIRISPGNTPLRKTKVFAKGFLARFGITARGSFPVEVRDGALYARIF
jgi:hypothetical protein